MKAQRYFWVALLILAWSAHVLCQGKDPCDCVPQVGKKPYRFEAKRETHYENYPAAKKPMTLSSTREWQRKYAKLMKKEVIPTTKRVKGTPEDSLYTLEGYLWYVKKEIDCDFHMQIGPKEKSGKRTVIELTMDNCEMQRAILDTLKSRGYSAEGKQFKAGIRVTVVGLGFYDGQHATKKAQEGAPSSLKKQEGTAWELHPVKAIVFR